jgi:diguanylate cyclase (GGDEF)-like protein/PAS domain S-box-containing protein
VGLYLGFLLLALAVLVPAAVWRYAEHRHAADAMAPPPAATPGNPRAGPLELQATPARVADAAALLVLLTLALLALAVIEPALRRIDRQAGRLAAREEALERLQQVADRTDSAQLLTGTDGRLTWANPAFMRLCGSPLDAAPGRDAVQLLLHAGVAPGQAARLRTALEQRVGVRLDLRVAARDGPERWLDIELQPLHGAGGDFRGHVGIGTDITRRVAEREHVARLLEALPAGVLVHSSRGAVVDANRCALTLLGCTREQLLGTAPGLRRWRVLHDDGRVCKSAELPPARTLRSGQGVRGEVVGVRRPDGALRWVLVNTEPLPDSGGVLSCFVDVTEQRRLQAQLHTLSRSDPLTGLANRAAVEERVQRAIDHARRHPGYGFAVLFMDFDRFKQVNDALGHTAGDELLRQVAARLDTALRPGDAVGRVASQLPMAARIGGDEFVVVLEGTRGDDHVAAVARRLQAVLATPYRVGAHAVQSGVSIGVVTTAHAADSASAVLRDADTAMFEAKHAGRGGCVVFDPSMHQRLLQRLALEDELRRALSQGELQLAYQPVVRLDDGALAAVEAIVHWPHPQRGSVPPAEFLPLADDSGLGDAIGAFVLRSACAQMAQWRQALGARAPRRVAVRLSPTQLRLTGLVADVRTALDAAGLPADALQLEITAAPAAQDDAVHATLRALKALGVGLVLGDFGIGGASLACLHRLPMDTVKVDRSFVRHADTVETHRVLIEATARVARTLGMATVAEGVETAGQATLLHALQCDCGQGGLYGPAMPAGELAAWIERRAEPAR